MEQEMQTEKPFVAVITTIIIMIIKFVWQIATRGH